MIIYPLIVVLQSRLQNTSFENFVRQAPSRNLRELAYSLK